MDPTRFNHPLCGVVFELFKAGKLVDVTTVANALAGRSYIDGAPIYRAYRIVAADLLACMTQAGQIVRHGKWPHPRWMGGPEFKLP